MRALWSLLVALLAFSAPLAALLPAQAGAQSTSGQDASSLMAEISALEQQINSLTSGSATPAPTSVPASSAAMGSSSGGSCPDFSRTLSLGSNGLDVVGLQTFLTQNGLFSGIATGYFGTLTQSAVAQWQEMNGVVSGGDANSTGLGVVGPRTRTAMDAACLSGGGGMPLAKQCLPASPPSTECPTAWQPITDTNGCTLYYQCAISLPTAGTTSGTGTQSSSTTSCSVVQKPICPGTVVPFQTNSNGCVTAYECVL
ncbi:MAG TPA: peptidoglycan-binding domain-containing protein [Candidatus Paceibacterota bacterium]|jgi:hypothetical protein|nr:peptidoglycan-binding domain-containing protein [Candidatus Paceibacterota bacterium]